MRIVACDVGKINFALCALEHEGPYEGGLSLLNCERALAEGRLTLGRWETLRLATQKRPTLATLLQGVVDLVRARLELFGAADLVVIESQMTAMMKTIAGALFAALRALLPALHVEFQHAVVKLSFGDLQAALAPVPARLETYAQRKRTAVLATRRLCAACPSAAASFAAFGKADDPADALLHALAALALHGTAAAAAPQARGRKRSAAAPPQSVQRGARMKRTESEVAQPSA
jgi:hypothetical protein